MLKVILGSALGGLVAGGIALMAAGEVRRNEAPAPSAWPASALPVASQSLPPTLACAPHQEAAVARVLVNGTEAATLTCVDRAPQGYLPYPQAAVVPQSQLIGLGPQAATVQVVPVSQPAATARTRPARQVVYREADDEMVRYEPDAKRRSVAKTALIIGGSAGTGAGVGAIVGGKKGALIGAAIGGGAASIFEATKR